MVSDIKRDVPKFDTVLLHRLHSNLSRIPTDINVLSFGSKALKIREFRTPFPPRYFRKNPRSMNARVPHGMAQVVPKIEKLFRIVGTAPRLEMVRAYGHRPRLWLLISDNKTITITFQFISVIWHLATPFNGSRDPTNQNQKPKMS